MQEDLLAALSSQHVTVHTNEEPDFDYMENGDVYERHALVPARSMACSMFSVVRTPKRTGTPVSGFTAIRTTSRAIFTPVSGEK